jgi:hypothetical protein
MERKWNRESHFRQFNEERSVLRGCDGPLEVMVAEGRVYCERMGSSLGVLESNEPITICGLSCRIVQGHFTNEPLLSLRVLDDD